MTTNQELRKLAETVLDDWISTYASEFCAPGRVKQAKERIKDGGGTIAYVTDMRESLSSGISALLDRIDRLEAENERLQSVIDSRPAINAGLPETYIEWSQGIYAMELRQPNQTTQ